MQTFTKVHKKVAATYAPRTCILVWTHWCMHQHCLDRTADPSSGNWNTQRRLSKKAWMSGSLPKTSELDLRVVRAWDVVMAEGARHVLIDHAMCSVEYGMLFWQQHGCESCSKIKETFIFEESCVTVAGNSAQSAAQTFALLVQINPPEDQKKSPDCWAACSYMNSCVLSSFQGERYQQKSHESGAGWWKNSRSSQKMRVYEKHFWYSFFK